MLELWQATLPSDAILMVWQGTIVREDQEQEAADFLKHILHLQHPPRIMGCIETLPTPGQEGTGGRIDLVFAIEGSDAPAAATQRLRTADIKWFSDIPRDLYPPLTDTDT